MRGAKFCGLGETRAGDVVTESGEIIGTWSVDETDFYWFTPQEWDDPVVGNFILEEFCTDVKDWHRVNRYPRQRKRANDRLAPRLASIPSTIPD